MADFSELIQYFNQSNGIPLEITVTSSTNWTQYAITIGVALLSSVFILFMIYQVFKPHLITLYLKLKLRKSLKKSGRRMIIIKHTDFDLFSSSMIDNKTMMKLVNCMNKIEGKDFDLVLYTPGGEVFSAMYISELLKSYPGKIRVIVPLYAMSGGTLLALSGNEIVMLPTSSLGPVDPQLGNLFKFGSAKSWDYIKRYKGKKSEDSTISFALMGQQYTKSISNHINYLLENKIHNEKKRSNFVKLLTSGEIEHSKILTPNILNSYGLDVKIAEPKDLREIIKVLISKGFEGVHLI